MKIEKKRYYFGFRYDPTLGSRIVSHCNAAGETLNRLVSRALLFTFQQHNRRKILFSSASGFLTRPVYERRTDAILILSSRQREIVRDFAYAYRRSMAEIIRIALEVYLDYLDRMNGKSEVKKHYYETGVVIIEQLVVCLFPIFAPRIPPDM